MSRGAELNVYTVKGKICEKVSGVPKITTNDTRSCHLLAIVSTQRSEARLTLFVLQVAMPRENATVALDNAAVILPVNVSLSSTMPYVYGVKKMLKLCCVGRRCS